MTTFIIIVVAILAAGAVITFVGAQLIERAHRPHGRFIDVGGFPQHVVEMGKPDAQAALPVVMLHGASANLEDMQLALAEAFRGRRPVIFVDRAGLGFSTRDRERGASPAYQAAVLQSVLDRLGVERAILVGHSWGGALALTFALDFPERTAGLVLVAPATHPGIWRRKRYSAVLAGPVGWFFARTLAFPLGTILMWPGSRAAFLPQTMPQRYVKRSAAMLVLRPPSLMANWADVGSLDAFLERQVARYATLAVPTIVVAGDRDPFVPTERHGEKLAAASPRVKLIVLPGFGHMLHHAAADRVVAAVDELTAAS
jgi:pimeloyl-ACP methyl ester carboxylesterase